MPPKVGSQKRVCKTDLVASQAVIIQMHALPQLDAEGAVGASRPHSAVDVEDGLHALLLESIRGCTAWDHATFEHPPKDVFDFRCC